MRRDLVKNKNKIKSQTKNNPYNKSKDIILFLIFYEITVDELISDVILWTPSHGRAKAGRPARPYIQQLCEDTGCSPGDLPEDDEQ